MLKIDKVSTGKKIQRLRESLNLTQEDFCGYGDQLAVRTLQKIEAGEHCPSLASAIYIANKLCCDISYWVCYVG